jgi:hypothetical protein
LAGKYYRDSSTQIVKDLNNQGKKVYFGIQKDCDVYTMIGEDSVCYTTESGVEKKY